MMDPATRVAGIAWCPSGRKAEADLPTEVGETHLTRHRRIVSGGDVGGPATTEGPGSHPPTTSDGPDLHFATTAVDFGVVPLGKEVGYAFSPMSATRRRINDVKVSVEEGVDPLSRSSV
jgi:hypothetical protein